MSEFVKARYSEAVCCPCWSHQELNAAVLVIQRFMSKTIQ